MPLLKIKSVELDKICKMSTPLINELQQLLGCPRDYFTIECIQTTYIKDGNIVNSPPVIEVEWFERPQETQDKAAEIITKYVQNAGYASVDVVFFILDKLKYYENGKHF